MIKGTQIVNCNIGHFLKIVYSIQFLMWGIIFFEANGLNLLFIREIVGFIYLCFLPGVLLLRILKMYYLETTEILLYSLGLSISTILFSIFFINLTFPLIDNQYPITTMNLSIYLGIIVSIFSFLAWLTDHNYYDSIVQNNCKKSSFSSPIYLFSILIPFCSILGTYFKNFYQSNFFLVCMFFMISIVLIFFSFTDCIEESFYSILVFLISISLVYHVSLFSTKLWGGDIYTEYYFSNLVLKKSIWDLNIPGNVNSTLSVVLLAPVFSNICNLSLTWVFKIIYPYFLSMVSVGLFKVYKSQTDSKTAFLSCILFVFLYIYYFWITLMPRQIVAELFLVLLMMLLVDKKMPTVINTFLFILFSISMVVSHYGLSDIFLICIVFAYLLSLISIYITKRISFKNDINLNNSVELSFKNIKLNFVMLYLVFLISWNIYISQGSAFSTVIHIWEKIANNIFYDFMDPTVTGGMNAIVMDTTSKLHTLSKYLHLFTQIFITIGLFKTFFGNNKYNFYANYLLFAISSFMLLLFSIFIPYFSNAIATSRIYHISMFFLAPFFVVGFVSIIDFIALFRNQKLNIKFQVNHLKLISIFLIFFLFFNTGLIYELSNDVPTSIPLNDTIDSTVFNDGEYFASRWLAETKSGYIYADNNRERALGFFIYYGRKGLPSLISDIPINSYIFLGTQNLKNKLLFGKTSLTFEMIESKNKIYDNSYARVYYIY